MGTFASILKPRFALLTTWRRNGSAVATPVWSVVSEGKAYVVSRGPGKVKRIRNNSSVSITPCTARGRVTGAEIRGVARIIDAALPDHVRRAFRAKYGPFPAMTRLMAKVTRWDLVLVEIEADMAERQRPRKTRSSR